MHHKTASLEPGHLSFVNTKSIEMLNKKKIKEKQSGFETSKINKKDVEK
jgi:hypothetical protein